MTTGWTEGKPWELAWGRRKRDGSDDRMDRGETVGNSLGRALLGRSETEATTGWTEGIPWELAWGRKKRDGSDDRVDRGETLGNSLGRAPLGRSETEATTGWTEGTRWEIAWGEPRCTIPCACRAKRHLNVKKWFEHVVFLTCLLPNVLRATTACTFSTSQLPKVVRTWCFFSLILF